MIRKLAVTAFVALAVTACSTPSATPASSTSPSQQAADMPPLTHGLFRVDSICPGCELGSWRAREPTPLLAEPVAGSRIVGTLAAGEWVTGVEMFAMETPRRGIILRDEETSQYSHGRKLDLRADDIVYFLYDSDVDAPLAMVWRRDDQIEISMDDPTLVRWDPAPPRLDDPRAGRWAQVRRANGDIGWVREPDLDCMNTYDPPDFCR